jgi:peptidoglycan/xylan/chitin deacetylase (PgdA/CDA1 family)
LLYPNKTGLIFRHLMPNCTWNVHTKKNEIFLTFDDGPIPDATEWVLNVLNEYNAKATFFCVGENIFKHPKIFEKILQNGHSVGNHTYNHLKGWKTGNQTYYDNIQKWEETIVKHGFQLQNKPLFRPPYGQITYSQSRLLSAQYELVMWSIITGDFNKNLDKETCLRKCLKLTKAGDIIVFHDSIKSQQNIYYLLPRYLEELKKRGFVFSKMG